MKSWVFLFVCWGGGWFWRIWGNFFFSGRSLSGSEFPLGMLHISWSYQPRSKIFFFHSCTIYYHLQSGAASFQTEEDILRFKGKGDPRSYYFVLPRQSSLGVSSSCNISQEGTVVPRRRDPVLSGVITERPSHSARRQKHILSTTFPSHVPDSSRLLLSSAY